MRGKFRKYCKECGKDAPKIMLELRPDYIIEVYDSTIDKCPECGGTLTAVLQRISEDDD